MSTIKQPVYIPYIYQSFKSFKSTPVEQISALFYRDDVGRNGFELYPYPVCQTDLILGSVFFYYWNKARTFKGIIESSTALKIYVKKEILYINKMTARPSDFDNGRLTDLNWR